MLLALGLLFIGALTRFMPHTANFSPVLAIALFGGVYLRRSQAIWVPLALMMITDIFLGLHSTIPFTWGCVLFTSLIGLYVRKHLTPVHVIGAAVASSLLFFVVTNFGSWLAFYPQTWEGFVGCYTLAVPFFRANVASTIIYSVILFGAYEVFAIRLKNTRLAVLLTK